MRLRQPRITRTSPCLPYTTIFGSILDDYRANRDCRVHFPAIAQVARGAAVDTPAHRFELVDDLHGPHLGRAGERTGREGGAQDVDVAHAFVEYAGYVRDQVHDVGITFYGHGVRYFDRAGFSHPAHIVAGQVDQLYVFGPFLVGGP